MSLLVICIPMQTKLLPALFWFLDLCFPFSVPHAISLAFPSSFISLSSEFITANPTLQIQKCVGLGKIIQHISTTVYIPSLHKSKHMC